MWYNSDFWDLKLVLITAKDLGNNDGLIFSVQLQG